MAARGEGLWLRTAWPWLSPWSGGLGFGPRPSTQTAGSLGSCPQASTVVPCELRFDEDAKLILERHKLTLVTLHIMNDTGWAGDLSSGWHGEGGPAADFAYLLCFGSKSRSLGRYGHEALAEMVRMTRKATSSVVMFGQGDAPKQAFQDAWDLQALFGSTLTKEITLLGRAKDRILVDVDGQLGYLGSRHSRLRGLDLRVGSVLDLTVESEEKGRLIVSINSG